MMNWVSKGRMIPLLLIFFCCPIPQLLNTLFYLHDNFGAILVSAVLALYVAVFTIFMMKYNAYRRNAEK